MSEYNSEMPKTLSVIICGAKGLAIGVIAAAVLLFVFAGIAYGAEAPDTLLSPLGYTALFASSVITGAVAGVCSRSPALHSALHGAVGGVMLLLVILLLSFIPAEAPSHALSPIVKLLMYAGIPITAALGGAVFGKRKKKRARHRRHR